MYRRILTLSLVGMLSLVTPAAPALAHDSVTPDMTHDTVTPDMTHDSVTPDMTHD